MSGEAFNPDITALQAPGLVGRGLASLHSRTGVTLLALSAALAPSVLTGHHDAALAAESTVASTIKVPNPAVNILLERGDVSCYPDRKGFGRMVLYLTDTLNQGYREDVAGASNRNLYAGNTVPFGLASGDIAQRAQKYIDVYSGNVSIVAFDGRGRSNVMTTTVTECPEVPQNVQMPKGEAIQITGEPTIPPARPGSVVTHPPVVKMGKDSLRLVRSNASRKQLRALGKACGQGIIAGKTYVVTTGVTVPKSTKGKKFTASADHCVNVDLAATLAKPLSDNLIRKREVQIRDSKTGKVVDRESVDIAAVGALRFIKANQARFTSTGFADLPNESASYEIWAGKQRITVIKTNRSGDGPAISRTVPLSGVKKGEVFNIRIVDAKTHELVPGRGLQLAAA